MSKVYFISDYHFGHAKVIEFEDRCRGKVLSVDTIQDHDEELIVRTLETINKRDTLWILGDNGNEKLLYAMLTQTRANIKYIPGNHDSITSIELLATLPNLKVAGITKWKNFWLTHAPVHPQELRGKMNIHGHNHSKVIRDPNYFCVSVENTGGYTVWGEEIRNGEFTTHNNFLLDN